MKHLGNCCSGPFSIRHSPRLVLLALTAVLGAGCGAPPDRPSGTAFRTPRAAAGHLARIRGQLAFIRCGGPPDTLWLADTPDHQVDSALATFGDGPLPALVRLDAGMATAVRSVAPDGPWCDRLPAQGLLVAHGNEPFWALTIGADSAVMTTPEARHGYRYGPGRWSRPDSDHWSYFAPGGDPGDTLRLDLTERRCIDGMSAAWFPFEATVSWKDRTDHGCAVEGAGAMESP